MPTVGRPKNPDTIAAPTIDDIDVTDIPVKREDDQTLQTAIENAKVLLEQKKELLAKIGKVRELCTLLVESEIGSRDQVRWVRFNLPRKTRKTGSVDGVDSSDNGDSDDE